MTTTASEGTVQWEDRWRIRAVIAAALGGLFPLAGQIIGTLPFADVPSEEGAQLLAVHDNQVPFLAGAVLNFLGLLCLGGALLFLFRATKARRPETPNVARITALAGPLLGGTALLARNVALVIQAGTFADSPGQSFDEADKLLGAGSLGVFAAVALAGQLALGFAFVLISLNAMRAGLLTRFMGVLGILCGVLFVIPIGSPFPIVQCFWMLALAFLFSGRWPNGVPPAWAAGEARPWPSQQELRERRQGEIERRRRDGGEPVRPRPPGLLGGLFGGRNGRATPPEPAAEPAPEPERATPAQPGAARAKRKRKKRR